MNKDLDNLFKLTKDYIKKACRVSSRAFQDDPVTIHMFPDEVERRKKVQFGFEAMYRYGIRFGEIYATSMNLEGISVWLPPNKVHQSVWNMFRNGGFRAFRKVGLKAMKRGMPIYRYIGPVHKRLAPFDHWYLQSIAVEPKEQGKGFGSLLLRAMIKRIDSEGLPIYLETNKEKNLSFYQKHGFEIFEYIVIPETDVPLWCMLRKPRLA